MLNYNTVKGTKLLSCLANMVACVFEHGMSHPYSILLLSTSTMGYQLKTM